MEKSFRKYRVVETEGMSAEKLQEILNEATDSIFEMQIDHVLGTKLILGFESFLNANGRAGVIAHQAKATMSATMQSGA